MLKFYPMTYTRMNDNATLFHYIFQILNYSHYFLNLNVLAEGLKVKKTRYIFYI